MSATAITATPAAPSGPAPEFNSAQFRSALSQFATGVTVITACQADGSFAGVTINSFNSVSLDPPLVLWSLAHTASCMASFSAAPAYVINVLAGDQVELAQRFARPGEHRFESLAFSLSRHGVPVLAGSVAWFECRHRSRYSEGDHVIFVGEVERCHSHPHRTLGFHRGRFIAI
jgi:flavin reductase (DIM6/NTAB) family NADH-FMN oxidoreductase RutF